MANGPRGLFWWVAFESAIDNGPKRLDLARAIEVCKATGAEWICVRASAGGHDDADLNAESIEAYVAAGLKVIIWIFDYTGSQAAELVDFARYRALGVTHAVLNAEYEYLSASPAQARGLVAELRAMGYEWIAHAPPDYAGARGDGPLGTLDEVCDAVLPQVYAYEHDDRGHCFHIQRVLELYAKRGFGVDKVQPILCSYRPRTRGYKLNPATNKVDLPVPIPPMANEPDVVAADVVAGLDLCIALGVKAPSIYTIDALHFINAQVGAAVLARVIEWASRQTPITDPAPPSFIDPDKTSDGWQPQTSVMTALPELFSPEPDEGVTDPAVPTEMAKKRASGEMPAVIPPKSEPDPAA